MATDRSARGCVINTATAGDSGTCHPSAWIGSGVILSPMQKPARLAERYFWRLIYHYHPRFSHRELEVHYGHATRDYFPGHHDMEAAPHNAYKCKDGRWVALGCTTEKHWEGLKAALGRPEWCDMERMRRRWQRINEQKEIDRHLSELASEGRA